MEDIKLDQSDIARISDVYAAIEALPSTVLVERIEFTIYSNHRIVMHRPGRRKWNALRIRKITRRY